MSAFVVTHGHINFLVNAAMKGDFPRIKPGDDKEADRVGNMLWKENRRSVAERYPRCGPDSLPGTIPSESEYVHSYTYAPVTPVQVMKACDCLNYQSCERDDWEESEACKFLTRLRESWSRKVAGYDDAEWAIA